MRTRIVPAVAMAMALAAAACGGGSDGDDEAGSGGDTGTVEIAVIEDLSGGVSAHGPETANGIELAVDEINEEGFMVGDTRYTIELSTHDAVDPATATQVAQSVTQEGTKFVLGPTSSALAGPVAQAVQRSDDVFFMAAATVLDDLAGQGDPIFKTQPPDSVTVGQVVPAALEQFPDWTTISFLTQDDATGDDILDLYPSEFEDAGVTVASEDKFAPTETNLSPVVQRAPADVDGFFTAWLPVNEAGLMDAAIEAGRDDAYWMGRGGDCSVGQDRAADVKGFICIVYTENAEAPSSPRAEDFFERYEAAFGSTPNPGFGLYQYDYVYALVEAMKAAGTVDDVDAVADAMRGLTYTDGVNEVRFDEEGINQSTMRIGVVTPDGFEVVPAQ